MGSDFYLDHQGAGVAAQSFESRARDLSGAATDLSGASTCGSQPVSQLVDQVMAAATGRMFAVSDELDILSKLVVSTVKVYNQLDVTYSTG